MDLIKSTGVNVKWTLVESLSIKFVSLVLSIVLARLLTPSDFGVLAIVNVFYLLTNIFVDGGLKEALIQKSDASRKDYSTTFWLNISIALLLYFILFVSAPFIENYYDYKDLSFYIRLQSLALIVDSVGLIQVVKATKNLDLKKVTLSKVPASIISFGVGIYFAFNGYGVLSLIIQQLTISMVYNFILVYTIRYKPDFVFSRKSVKSLYAFGLKMLAISIINRSFAQSLNLIFASYFNIASLGVYTKSRSLQSVPIEIINSAFSKGIYPTIIRVQRFKSLLSRIYVQNIYRLLYLMFFVNSFTFCNANEIVLLLLGNEWLQMVPYLRILAIGSLFLPVVGQSVNIIKALGKPNSIVRIEFCWKASILLLILSVIKFSHLAHILLCVAIIDTCFALYYFGYVSKLLNINFRRESRLLIIFCFYHLLVVLIVRVALLYAGFNNSGIIGSFLFILIYAVGSISFGLIYPEKSIKRLFKI